MWHEDSRTSRRRDPHPPTEAEVAGSADAVAGLALVEARVARCTEEDQAAFWEAVGRCFGGGKPPDHRGAGGAKA